MSNAGLFTGDKYKLQELTAAILNIEVAPTRLAELGLFESEGVPTTSVAVENENGKLTLVPAGTRGQNGASLDNNTRDLKIFNTVHLKVNKTILATEYADIRAFGEASVLSSFDAAVLKYQEKAKENILATIEYQRLGAIKGKVLDANGTTVLHDLFSIFGIAQKTAAMDLTNITDPVTQKFVAVKRGIEKAINNKLRTGFRVLCGSEFFDKLTTHPTVRDAYQRYMEGAFLRADNRKGFPLGGCMIEEYAGGVNGTDFIAADDAYMFPEGVKGLFLTRFAPADYTATVNTTGLPLYSKLIPDDYDRGVELEVQSNPINICTNLNAVYKLVI